MLNFKKFNSVCQIQHIQHQRHHIVVHPCHLFLQRLGCVLRLLFLEILLIAYKMLIFNIYCADRMA